MLSDSSFAFPRRPLLGRDRELAALRAGLAAAASGHGGLVLLEGEAGIGKTRLLEQVAHEGAAAGARVRWGRCYEREGAPAFWPWVQVLRKEMQSRDPTELRALLGGEAADLARLVPELRELIPDLGAGPALDTPDGRFRCFESVVNVLGRIARETPLVILLDDVQSADEPSLLLLELATHMLDALRILIVATYRDPGFEPSEPMATRVKALARTMATERITLGGLDREAVAEWVARAVSDPAPVDLIAALHTMTAGNPFHLGEIVRSLGEHGTLAAPTAVATAAMPAGVHDAIARHVGMLSPRSVEVLRIAAVLGRDFALTILERVAVQAREEVVAAIDEATAAHLVLADVEGHGRHQFAHGLIRDSLYEALEPAARRAAHGRVATVLAARADEDEHLAEIAHHFAASGPSGGAMAHASYYARRAADRALATLAFEEAERLYTMALRYLDDDGHGDPRLRASLLIALGTAQSLAANLDRARATFVQAAAGARSIASRELLAQAVLGYGGELTFPEAGARDDVHIAMLEEALALWNDEDSNLHARLLVHLATALYFTGASSRRVAMCDHAVAMARRLGDEETLAEVLIGAHNATSAADNAHERLGIAQALLRLANRRGDRRLAFRARSTRFWDHLELGDSAGADADLEACDDLARDLRQPSYTGLVVAYRATRATLRGRFEEAEALAAEVLANGRWLGRAADIFFTLQMMMLRYLQGRMGEVTDVIRAVVAMSPGIVGARCGLALCLLQLGHEAEARAEVAQVMANALTDLPRNGTFLPTVVQLAEACALLDERVYADIVYAALAPHAAACAVIPNATAFVGAVSHYLGLLARTRGDHDDAARYFERAITTHAGMGAEPWLALSRFEYAAMLFARGGSDDVVLGATLLEQTVEAAEALGMQGLVERSRTLRVSAASDTPARRGVPKSPALPVDSSAPTETGLDLAVLRQEGDFWTMRYGGRSIRLRDTRGLRYLAQLLWHPAREFHADELVQLAAATEALAPRRSHATEQVTRDLGDAGEAIDDQARRAYRRHVESLRDQIEEAERNNDDERAGRLRDELETVAAALRTAPQGRRVAAHTERARLTVTKGIKAALTKIQASDPSLGRHLSATIRRGYVCVYLPDPRHPITWER